MAHLPQPAPKPPAQKTCPAPPCNSHDAGAVRVIVKPQRTTAPANRAAVLTATRNAKMAESAHAYVRGSTVKFYEWLDRSERCALPEGPAIWICGDCHVGNLGPIAGAAEKVEIQIRDLDQTVIGNPSHDLVRLGLSLAMAARSSDLPGVTTARMLEQVVSGYRDAMSDDAGSAKESASVVRRALRRAAGRSWKHLADERIEGCDPAIPLGKRFWPLMDEERAAIGQAFSAERVRRLVTLLRSRDDDAGIRVIDAAYWRKGCSSLGRLRYAVLVAIEDGRKSTRHCLVDVKEAAKAAAPRGAGGGMPADDAERVVEGARHLAPLSGRAAGGGAHDGQERVHPGVAAPGPEAGDRGAEPDGGCGGRLQPGVCGGTGARAADG